MASYRHAYAGHLCAIKLSETSYPTTSGGQDTDHVDLRNGAEWRVAIPRMAQVCPSPTPDESGSTTFAW